MNFKEIEDLLEKYYNGETTLEEENQLKEFFSKEPVPFHLEPDAALFHWQIASSDQKLDDAAFEEKFMKRIETPVIPFYSSKKKFYFAASLAAVILLLIGFLFTFRNVIDHKPFKNTLSDPGLAYAETRKALLLVSVNFNEGLDQVQHLSSFQKGIDQVQHLSSFQTGMNEMQKFSTFYKYQTLIINPGDKRRQKNN